MAVCCVSPRHGRLARALVAASLAIVAASPARADEPVAPVTVIIAEVAGRADHGALRAVADAIARDLGIDRARQATAWRTRTRDGYQAATVPELLDAAATVEQRCAAVGTGGPIAFGDEVPPIRRAAAILARAAGDAPGEPRGNYHDWQRIAAATYLAARCLPWDGGATRIATVPLAAFGPSPVDGRRRPAIYVDGRPATLQQTGRTVEFALPVERDALVHVRCGETTRCSPLVRVPAGPEVREPLALLDLPSLPTVGDDLTLGYPDVATRNQRAGEDAARLATAVVDRATSGASLVVLDEGGDVRLVLVDPDGAPLGTRRARWSDAAAVAAELLAGESRAAIGAPRDGLYTVLLREVPGAPRLVSGATPFDARPIPLRQYCRDHTCGFAAPPGRLQLTMRRTGLVDDELVRSIPLDADLEITAVPGRRYAAKYVGEGMMLAGGGVAVGTALAMGLIAKAGQSACSAVTSGPDDCDQPSFTSDTATAVFFTAAGTAAVGAILYFVVHKRPTLRIRTLARPAAVSGG